MLPLAHLPTQPLDDCVYGFKQTKLDCFLIAFEYKHKARQLLLLVFSTIVPLSNSAVLPTLKLRIECSFSASSVAYSDVSCSINTFLSVASTP